MSKEFIDNCNQHVNDVEKSYFEYLDLMMEIVSKRAGSRQGDKDYERIKKEYQTELDRVYGANEINKVEQQMDETLQRSEDVTTCSILGLRTGMVRGVEVKEGLPIECPRCNRTDNWRLGGHKNAFVWVCGHGPVDYLEMVEDIVSIPFNWGDME